MYGVLFKNKFEERNFFVDNDKYKVLVITTNCIILLRKSKKKLKKPRTNIPFYAFRYDVINNEHLNTVKIIDDNDNTSYFFSSINDCVDFILKKYT